jgi:exosortase
MSSSNIQEKTGSLKLLLWNNLQALIAGALFLLAYVPTLMWMWERWFARDSYYSHGILIPFVTGYLIWQKKEELARIVPKRSRLGMPLIVFGLLVHLVSSILRVYFTSGFSMLIALVGLILHFYGRDVFKKIFFPVLFLVFMVPVPLVVITNISFRMKLLAAEMATDLLNRMRIPAIQEGSLIKMRHAYVIVEDVCSGLRSLISLTALGSIFAYWMKGPMWKKGLLFLSTVPIAIITNVCRIIFLAAISEIWGSEHATGLVHDFSGFMVFALAFMMLYGVGKILE